MINVCLFPFHVALLYAGHKGFIKIFKGRKIELEKRNMIAPSKLEVFMAFTCLLVYIYQCYIKIQSKYLIFMLNPCHWCTLFLIGAGFSNYGKFGLFCAVGAFGFSFGGWIGTLFNENEGIPMQEVVFYYIEHILASFGGTVILAISGRYRI